MNGKHILFLAAMGVLSFATGLRAETTPAEAIKQIEKLNADVAKLRSDAEAAKAAIDKQTELEAKARTEQCIAALQQLQDSLAKSGQLDEAVAVRDRIRTLKVGGGGVKPDPGTLSGYINEIGNTFYFEVVGATHLPIYGSDIYSTDSQLAVAAVHAGALAYAEKGVVKVTILPGKQSYSASSQNGVNSREYSSHHASYKVEKAAGFKTTKLGEPAPAETKPAAATTSDVKGAILEGINKEVEGFTKELEKGVIPGLRLKPAK